MLGDSGMKVVGYGAELEYFVAIGECRPQGGKRRLLGARGGHARLCNEHCGSLRSVDADRAHQGGVPAQRRLRSEEHTPELQSLLRTSSAVFCLKKQQINNHTN